MLPFCSVVVVVVVVGVGVGVVVVVVVVGDGVPIVEKIRIINLNMKRTLECYNSVSIGMITSISVLFSRFQYAILILAIVIWAFWGFSANTYITRSSISQNFHLWLPVGVTTFVETLIFSRSR